MSDVVLVTGASSALGAALLSHLAMTDAVVYVHHASGRDKLQRQLATQGGNATFIPVRADFAARHELEAMIAKIREQHIRANKIVHLAAMPLRLERFGKETWEHLVTDLEVSLRSFMFITQAFLPVLARERVGGRVVVALSSVTSGMPPSGMAHYTTVKFALLGLVRSLAVEFAGSGITVNAVSPYTMDTPFLAGVPHKYAELSAAHNPQGRNATVEDVVPAIAFLLSDASSFITGSNIPISGGAAF